jgi:DNA-directed RNA polymerase specialized sigma24 family protein
MNAEERIEKLLALLLLRQLSTQAEKAVQLRLAGFTNSEIANLLDTTANVVGQRLLEARKKAKKGKAKKVAKKK